MMDTNKNKQVQETASETVPEVKTRASTSKGWRGLMSKRWAFPAIYVAAAALILTFMWVYQDNYKTPSASQQIAKTAGNTVGDVAGKADSSTGVQPDGALAVNAPAENMAWPVPDHTVEKTVAPFYDAQGSDSSKVAAMVQYGNTFTPHTGIDLARDDGQTFNVMAALSGKVTMIDQNPLVGNLVEITNNDGLITVYQSLGSVEVTQGEEVKQGDVIATAGRNDLEKTEGNHLHFEIRQASDGSVLNPESLIGEPVK